ncbi:NAD-dependent epimerase/dehydratase family protein [Wenxinia saemankumensis]|uniref:Nucleoside-diphosphate-sugar epimerase n=1 Tax=Wenxinia saemankumensis TaxID=1447782 RepID=A0A1M6B200_9RHOB|nr:NAD(P)-dependent oxidoreductase [Wenxinia saemankumensis]SHI42736.1 Nucleoside-diphosphate-sugar epimerase [Wenxinia saemankumensis]
MRIAVTGATGFVGHHVVAHLIGSGHEVTTLGRRPSRHEAAGFAPFDLDGPAPDLRGHEVLVHAALSHVPGRYRGGEGDAPEAFLRRNLDGTIRLFGAARDHGVARIVLLSSRAVYGDYPPGTILHEGLAPRPDTLYGQVKLRAEEELLRLASAGMAVASLRATGVFGPPVPGLEHKWARLFDDYFGGRPVTPRVASEVHSADLAEAVRLVAVAPPDAVEPALFNVTDLVLDRRDLLAAVSTLSGVQTPLPPRSDPGLVSVMTTDRLRRLGWTPSGARRLRDVLAGMVSGARPRPA